MSDNPAILITGANGFVGRVLSRDLAGRGHFVTGTVRNALKDTEDIPALELRVTGDIETFAGWRPLLEGADAVIHLAARVHVMGSGSSETLAQYRKINVDATRRLIRAAAEALVRRIIFVSSVKAVGEGGMEPYSETTAPEPTDPYGISKLEAEQVVKDIGRESGIETVILRLPLVYGPGVQANFLRLLKLVDMGVPLPLASVRNQRSMIYIGNLVDVVHACLHHEHAAGEIFMVSDGDDFSTPGLIQAISGRMGREPRLLPFPTTMLKMFGALAGKGQEVQRLLGSFSVDISKLRNRLDWLPPYTVEQGIEETVAWYQKTISH